MAVRIRLTRVGATKRPSYRVVATDSRTARDGRALEILGFYDPLTEPATVKLDGDRLHEWISRGAQPSESVTRLMRLAGLSRGRDASERSTAAPGAKAAGPVSETAEAAAPASDQAAPTARPRRARRTAGTAS